MCGPFFWMVVLCVRFKVCVCVCACVCMCMYVCLPQTGRQTVLLTKTLGVCVCVDSGALFVPPSVLIYLTRPQCPIAEVSLAKSLIAAVQVTLSVICEMI